MIKKLFENIKLKRFKKFLEKLQKKIRNSKDRCYSKKGYSVYINMLGEFIVFSHNTLRFLNKDERTAALMEIYGVKVK